MYSKYLKYKNKYLQLKNQDGGAASASTEAVKKPIQMNGKIVYLDGNYIGEYLFMGTYNLKHGHGIMNYTNKNIYEGDFKNNQRNGWGKFIFSDGIEYEGEHVNNAFNGKGKIKYPDGNVYIGDFVDSKFNGIGKMTYSNGNVYIGQFKNNLFEGSGKMTYSNGNVYIGQFKNHLFEGFGKLTFAETEGVYEGSFLNDKSHGLGTFSYKNGDKYVGNYENGVCDGIVKFIFADGLEKDVIYSNNEFIIEPTPTIYQDLQKYTIILYINSHGCDVTNQPIRTFYPNINPIYVSPVKYKCNNTTDAKKDLIYFNILFNTVKHPIQYYQIKNDKTVKSTPPDYEHIFAFGIKKRNVYDLFDGIFIVQNNIGLLNNINLLNLTVHDNVNTDANIMKLSTAIAFKIKPWGGYNKTMKILELCDAVSEWFTTTYHNKKLDLVLLDNSCRSECS